MIYILGRKPLNTSHELHPSMWSKCIVCSFWPQVSHIEGIEGLLVFALGGWGWRQYITTFEPQRSSSNTDACYAIVWAFCGGNTAH